MHSAGGSGQQTLPRIISGGEKEQSCLVRDDELSYRCGSVTSQIKLSCPSLRTGPGRGVASFQNPAALSILTGAHKRSGSNVRPAALAADPNC